MTTFSTNCVTPENHKTDKDKKHITKTATTTRPSDSHMINPAAQQLCNSCAELYDRKIQERQQDAQDQRKKDLERKRQ